MKKIIRLGIITSIFFLLCSQAFTAYAQTPKVTITKAEFSNGVNNSGVLTYEFKVSPVAQNQYINNTFSYNVVADGQTYVKEAGVAENGTWNNNTITIRGTVNYDPGSKPSTGVFVRLMQGQDHTTVVTATAPKTSAAGVGKAPASNQGAQFDNTIFGAGQLGPAQYFYKLYVWAVSLAVLAAAISIIRAGYIYTVGRGNPSAINSAKEIILNAVLGLTLLLLSYTILQFLLGKNKVKEVNGVGSGKASTQQNQPPPQQKQNQAPTQSQTQPQQNAPGDEGSPPPAQPGNPTEQ